MSHNIGVQDNNISTDSFGHTLNNISSSDITNQNNLPSYGDQEAKGFTIDLVRKYINEYKLNLLPTIVNSKRPDGNWSDYQNKVLTEDEINLKFQNIDNANIRVGIVCGSISGGLEIIDFDNKFGNIGDVYNQFLSLPNVKAIVDKCPVEKSQSGGYHIYYRCEEIEGNKKLAAWPNGKDKKGKDIWEAIIETRGEGGFCVCSPSQGYKLLQGSFADIPVISIEERDTLLSAARSFTKKINKEKKGFRDNKRYEESPWVMYDQSDVGLTESKELLKDNGWTLSYGKDETEFWCRPGKTEGISASFKGNTFYVFSSNADPFDEEKYYFPSQIYTYLTYGTESEDFKKSTLDFLNKGFGKRISKSKRGSRIEITDVEDFLSEEYDFRLNEVTSKLEWKKKNEETFRAAEDYDISSIHRSLQHREINYGYDKLNNLLNSDYVTLYDPIREYFESLPKWDGVDYIKGLSETVKLRNPNLNDYWYTGLKKFLIAMVGCAIVPEITNETSIIFYGEQGEGKTKWLNRLVPEKLNPQQYLFVGTIYDDKDSKINLSTRLLINLDELGSFNRQEIGYLKSLFTLNTISLREPYMRKSRNFIRRASFVGSIDREEFLTDLSGTRRFLTYAVSDVNYQHEVDMNKVFSQAYSLFKDGERYYFNKDEIKDINDHNEEFRLKSFEEELLQMNFSIPEYVSSASSMTTTEIANVLSENNLSFKVTNASLKKIGEAMNKLGYEKKSIKKDGKPLKCWLVKRVDPLTRMAHIPAVQSIMQN